jgi:hypothetical protein
MFTARRARDEIADRVFAFGGPAVLDVDQE